MDDEWNRNLDVQDNDDEIQTVSSPNENLPREPLEEPQATILQEEYKEKLGNKPVHILFTGLAGAGKSTLVNTMLGEVLARTGYGPDSIEASKSYYEGVFEGVQLRVHDTCGYSSESKHKIPKSRSFDLILICIKITNRLSNSEIELLKALGKALDKEAWNRTVIVLTFANFLIHNSKIKALKTEEAKCQAINDIRDEYIKSIREHLIHFMDKETLRNIPFCLAGESDPLEPTDRSVRELPTTEDWLVDLWEICANRISPEYKRWFDRLIDFIQKTLDKIFKRRTEDRHQQSLEEQQDGGQQDEEQQDGGQQDEEQDGGQLDEEQQDGGQQDEEQDGGQQVEEQDGGQQDEEQQDGGQQDEEQDGGQQDEEQQDRRQQDEEQQDRGQQDEKQQDRGQQDEKQQDGGQQVEEQDGGQQVEEQQDGGQQDEEQDGGQQDEEQDGGQQDEEQDGGQQDEEQQDGGQQDEEKLDEEKQQDKEKKNDCRIS